MTKCFDSTYLMLETISSSLSLFFHWTNIQCPILGTARNPLRTRCHAQFAISQHSEIRFARQILGIRVDDAIILNLLAITVGPDVDIAKSWHLDSLEGLSAIWQVRSNANFVSRQSDQVTWVQVIYRKCALLVFTSIVSLHSPAFAHFACRWKRQVSILNWRDILEWCEPLVKGIWLDAEKVYMLKPI